jgi:hypothetical protein
VRSSLVLSAALSGLGLGLLVAMPLAHGDAKGPTIGVDEIKEGMKGYGLTVFKGTEPERFDVEVVGVLHNFRPSQDLILVKTPHPRLNVTKNVKGMSGSPIYFDGRLAGAYAYSLSSFQAEPVAGITPIKPMLTELSRPVAPGFWPLERGASPLPATGAKPPQKHAELGGTGFGGAPGEYDLREHAKQMHARFGGDGRGIVPAGTPLLVGGLSDRAMSFARSLFEPMGLEVQQAGGGTGAAPAAGAPEHFVDGGSLGVQLARGDVSFMGLGTVTHVEGRKLCGFGHPMMNAGDTALPTTLARVLWIYASEQHSFKVGEGIRPLGALVQDRQSAVVADETKVAPTFPVHVEVKGVPTAPRTSWNMVVAEERFMSAGLVASMLGSVVDATVSDNRDASWQLHSKVKIQGLGTLEVDDFGVAIGGMPEAGDFAQTRAVRALGELLNNPWQPVRVESVEAELSVTFTRDMWRLRGADLLDPVVDAGAKARVVLHLQPFVGPEVTRTVELAMPAELAGKEAEVEIVPGYEVPIEVAAPESVRDLFANAARQSLPPKTVVLQVKTPRPGVAFRGRVANDLPDFAFDALRSQTSDLSPEAVQGYARSVVTVDRYLSGHAKVKVKVRPVVR